ncbi:hypothetical protein [Pseudodesulfovibrio sediminis]|uniref:PilZ domain-containing protein n=1 Tax=Pseudodesulfovibrio sediminis TaxID=2810563 RepID=A0ABN6ELK0_9BACT|nr:hypothetical protein [Pseudodesulfovibrio sediminis]BCS86829.1 hypothetical protein PSDVSF_00710 [Pseudodesulfovibrio sediminis]
MIEYLVQSDYLREVQRTFGGAGKLDMLGVFSQIFMVAVPVIVIMALWHYRNILAFALMRLVSYPFNAKTTKVIGNYLVSQGVMIEVCLYSSDGIGRTLCNVRVVGVEGGRMQLKLVNVNPAAVKLKNRRVVCFMKPFAYTGKRLNAFVTYISHMERKGIVLKELSLLTPIRYKYILRRRHTRQQVAREGAVRVKAWSGRKVNTFWMIRPDLQTVNNPARYGRNTRLAVENISAGGVRMFIINPKGELPPLQKGNQLVLRISIWNPAVRKYVFFTALGTIRSRFTAQGGAIGLGIQFASEGEQVGRRFVWNTVQGEIKPLAKFLAQLDQ